MADENEVFNVVSEYSDKEAVEDGLIHDVSKLANQPIVLNGKPVNRVTNTVMGEFSRAVEAVPTDKPHLNQNVLTAVTIYMLQSLTAIATDADGDGFMYVVKSGEVQGVQNTFWFVANEVGGYTLMRPEDY